MGDKNIKKETKKPKKSDKASKASSVSFTPSEYRPVIVQPELIKKEKKKK